MARTAILILVLFIFSSLQAYGQYTGTFSALDVGLQVTLQQGSSGIEGHLSGGAASARLEGRARGEILEGTVYDGHQEVPFRAQLCAAGDHLSLHLPLGGRWQTITLERISKVPQERRAESARTSGAGGVIINGERVPAEQVRVLERRYQVRIQDGAYWYDAQSGAWGLQGGPTAGFIVAGLNIGGILKANASGGRTGVYVNGRALHPQDLAALQQLVGPLQPGRYWLDAQGNAGPEGGPAAVNLAQLARSRQGSSHYRSGITDIGVGSSSEGFYIMGEDFSYSSF